MSSFLSLLAKQISNVIAPQVEADGDEATHIWQSICNCTLDNSPDSLLKLHSLIQDLLEVIKLSAEQGTKQSVIEILTSHQIPSKLVAFAEADIPNGFINEVIPFFIEFTFEPLSFHLNEPFIIDAVNKLLQLSQISDPGKFEILMDSILEHLNRYPDDIEKFIVSENSAPFLSELAKNISMKYNDIGEFIFPLLAQTKYNKTLHSFLVNSTQFIQNLVRFVKGCVEKCSVNPKKRQFILFLDIALQSAQPDFVASFYTIFEQEIFKPLIENPTNSSSSSMVNSLKSSIYILTAFNTIHIIKPVMEFVQTHINEYLDSKNENIIILAIRCIALIIEHSIPKFEAPPEKQNINLFLDFLALLPPEWFVKSDMMLHAKNAESRVNLNFSSINTISNSSDWEISETLQKVLKLFDNFLDNGLRLNLALTEFFSLIASLSDQGATFFALSDDCENGLVKTLQTLCTTAKRRVGKKSDTRTNIENAYEILADGQTDGNGTFNNIVTLIEFCQELKAIAQTKNLFHQRDEYFMA